MISGSDCENAIMLIDESVSAGSRLEAACKTFDITTHTYGRGKALKAATGCCEDHRPTADHSMSEKELDDEIKRGKFV